MKTVNVFVFILSATLLAACGFKPMNAPNTFGAKGVNYSNISISTASEEKIDFLLKHALRDRMGENHNSIYTLKIKPKLSRRTLGIGADDVASRYDLIVDTNFELVEVKTGSVVFKDKVQAISTFGAPRDPYGTTAAQNNAAEQVAVEAADRIIARLARYNADK